MSYLAVGQHSPRREAAKALKARNIPAQGKHAESVRRPGYNGDYVSVPRPLRPQSASPTGAEEAMEPHFFCLLCRPSSGCLDEEDAFQGLRQRRNPWLVCRTLSACLGIAVNVIIERPLSHNAKSQCKLLQTIDIQRVGRSLLFHHPVNSAERPAIASRHIIRGSQVTGAAIAHRVIARVIAMADIGLAELVQPMPAGPIRRVHGV